MLYAVLSPIVAEFKRQATLTVGTKLQLGYYNAHVRCLKGQSRVIVTGKKPQHLSPFKTSTLVGRSLIHFNTTINL